MVVSVRFFHTRILMDCICRSSSYLRQRQARIPCQNDRQTKSLFHLWFKFDQNNWPSQRGQNSSRRLQMEENRRWRNCLCLVWSHDGQSWYSPHPKAHQEVNAGQELQGYPKGQAQLEDRTRRDVHKAGAGVLRHQEGLWNDWEDLWRYRGDNLNCTTEKNCSNRVHQFQMGQCLSERLNISSNFWIDHTTDWKSINYKHI